MDIRLIATDMDGTFLDKEGGFDRDRFERLLTVLESRGIGFVIASGNGMDRLLSLCQGFEDRLLFLSDNGARLVRKGKTYFRHQVRSEQVSQVLEYFSGRWHQVCLMLANDQTIYMQAGGALPFHQSGIPIKEEEMQQFLSRIRFLDSLAAYPKEEVVYKMGLWIEPSQVEQVVSAFNQAFAGNLVAVTSGYGSIDILPFGIHKAWGLSQVMEERGLTPDQVMAFGDSDNDIEMLQLVTYSYAMENGTDKVKASARYLAPSNKDQGVLTVLESFFLASSNKSSEEGQD